MDRFVSKPSSSKRPMEIDDADPEMCPEPPTKRPLRDMRVDGVNDIAENLTETPHQPILKNYPKRKFGDRFRSFQKEWYQDRPWLEYSQSADASFCYSCRAFFGSHSNEQWTRVGFSNWKNAMDDKKGLKVHETSAGHLESTLKWTNYQETIHCGSITSRLKLISRQDILDNRHFIKTVSQAVMLCAVQDIALRGHREGRLVDGEGDIIDQQFNCGFRNRGNFLEILCSYAVHDEIIRKKIQGPRNAQYVHHDIQDELLSLLANSVRNDILTNLRKAKYFSLLCDESKDLGKDEQLSLCIRYVVDGAIYEDFYNFIRAEGLDARSVMMKLKNTLYEMEVDCESNLVPQCYDGANVMSGRLNGLQAIMRNELCPKGIYVHCWAHRLNLVVVSCIHNIDIAVQFFENMATIYSFFSSSVPHEYFVNAQKECKEDADINGKALQQKELKSLSKTRWCCQAEACDAVASTLGSIIQTVEHFAEDCDNPSRRTSGRFLVSMIDTNFIMCLVIFQNILRKSAIVANYLQSKDMDVARAVDLIKALKSDLTRDTLFDGVWIVAKNLIDRHNIAPLVERRRRTCREDAHRNIWAKPDYKELLFDKVIEVFVSELNRRFSEEACTILNSMSALLPGSRNFLDLEVLKPFVDHYNLRGHLMKSECNVFAVQFSNSAPECKNMLDILQFIEPHRVCYTQLYKAYQIACTIPITTTENERSISCMKRVKTYLRSSMDDLRLGDLGTLSLNK